MNNKQGHPNIFNNSLWDSIENQRLHYNNMGLLKTVRFKIGKLWDHG